MTNLLSTPQLLIMVALASGIAAVGALIAFRVRDHLAESRLRDAAARNPILHEILEQLEERPSLKVRRTLSRREFLDDAQRVYKWIERTRAAGASATPTEPFPDARLVDRYLVQIRRGSDETARAAAAGLLGWTASSRIVPPLLAAAEIANRRSPLLRKMALRSLSRVRHPDAVRLLLEALERAEDDVVELLIDVCAQMGAPIVEPVAEALADPANAARMRIGSARILGGIEHHSVVPALVAALSDRDAEVRAEVATSLAWTRDDQVIERLTELLLTDPVIIVRSAVARALHDMAPDHTLRTLGHAFSDARPETRVRVVEALEQLGSAAHEILVIGLGDPDHGVARSSARALQRIGAIEASLRCLETEGYDPAHAEFLIEVGRTGHIEPLLDALEDSSAGLLREVVRLLARVGDPRAGEALSSALDRDISETTRARIVDALRRVRDTSQTHRVLQLLASTDEWVRKACVDYLAEFGSPLDLERVLPLLEDPNPWTRASALRVIELLASRGFDPTPVRARLADPYDFVRAQAIRTLCARHDFDALFEGDLMDHIVEDRIRNELLRALGDHATVVAMPLITRLAAFSSDRDLDLLRHAARRALTGLEEDEVDLLLLGYADPDEETSSRWFASIAWPQATSQSAKAWRDELLTDADPRVRAGMVAALADRDQPRADLIVAVHRAIDDPAPVVVRAGLATAGRCGLHELQAAAADALRHDDDDVRINASFCQALLDPGPSRIDELLLRKGAPAERVAATAARLMLDDARAIADWIAHLRMGSDRRIVETWIRREHSLYRHLRKLAREKHESLAAKVFLCRSAFDVEEQLAHVLAHSPDEADRVLALRSLVTAGTDRCVGHIRGAFFRDPSPSVRADALAHLVERNPQGRRREYLEFALQDRSDEVRVRATRLLSMIHPPEAVALLADRLGTGTRAERTAAVDRLAVLLEEHGEQLLDHVLKPERPGEAMADLVRVLDRCTLPVCVDLLDSMFAHEDDIVRITVLRPLLRRLGGDGWRIVDRAIRDPHPKLRARAAQALGTEESVALRGDVDHMRHVLRELHGDPDPEVRSRTAVTVAKLGIDGTMGLLGSLEHDDDPRVERIARQARLEFGKARQKV